ncbi:Ferredoxin-2 [Mycobacteroides abscessus subsp. abscessus]|nr:Ferredoxin-2 [Mycobacteroides abscessus subsp. abscessus]
MVNTMAIRVHVDGEMCIASGYCVRSVPEVFGEAPDGVAQVEAGDNVPASLIDAVLSAQTACPSQAIVVESD